jgi:hypothetical protein
MRIGQRMLLVCGPDRPLLERICGAVSGETRIVDDFAFEQALKHPAVTLLRVERIPRAGESPPEPGSLASLLSAAEAPSVSRVIIVTPRGDADGGLRRLRQSGARYVILRPPPLVDVEALRGKRVLVPRDAVALPLVTIDDLVRAIRDVIADEAMMGQTIEVPPSGLAALEAAGAKPRVVAPWRAKLGRWLGQPVLAASPAPSA